MSDKKIKVVEVIYEGFGNYTAPADKLEGVFAEIREGTEVGDTWTVHFAEMDRAEYDALPEFDGF